MSAPDRVWLETEPEDGVCVWYDMDDGKAPKMTEYLRATPARLHAEELAEALLEAVSALREIRDDNKARGALYSSKTQGVCRASLKVAGGVLDKLQKEEGT